MASITSPLVNPRGGAATQYGLAQTGGRSVSSVYNYNLYKFPADIVDNRRHGGNFCVFYINVRDRSKTVTSNNTTVQNISGVPRSQQGTAGTRLIGNAGSLGGLTSNLKRTNTAICTYMPHNITLQHGTEYEKPELGLLGSIAANGAPSMSEALVEGTKTFLDTSGAILQLFGAVAGGAVGKVTQGAGANLPTTTIKNIASAVSGIALNPHVEVLFKGVKHRQFKFVYDFYPKSELESQNVRELINLFRFHMHPELLDPAGAARAFIFPSEFDIYFYHQNAADVDASENPWLFVISSCVLTDINVNYTSPGIFAAHEKGQPVGIKVELSFQELEIMTKERLSELEFRPFNSIPETTQGF